MALDARLGSALLPDGQPVHARHAQIARRANLSQDACSEIRKIS
jgi:hypothetical protein